MADQLISLVSAREGVTKISSNYWNFQKRAFNVSIALLQLGVARTTVQYSLYKRVRLNVW